MKIGSRERVSISRESACAAVKLASDGTVEDAVLTLGSAANTPIYLYEFAHLTITEKLTEDTIAVVIPVAAQTIHDHCRPTNRLYKTEAGKGLNTDVIGTVIKHSRKL